MSRNADSWGIIIGVKGLSATTDKFKPRGKSFVSLEHPYATESTDP